MYLKFSALVAVLLSSSAVAERSALRKKQAEVPHQQTRRELQSSCAGYDTSHETTSGTINAWSGGGKADTEWLNKANWQNKYLPGIHSYNKVIMAVNDAATVNCDATYMKGEIAIEARAGATLDATADLNIARELVLKTRAAVTQTSTSQFTLGKNLNMLAVTYYNLSDQASLSIGLNLYMAINSELTIKGDGTSILASTETPTVSQIHGQVKYVFGPSGTGIFDVQGELLININYAKLVVDGTSYTAGGGSIPLIKYTKLAAGSAFGAANIDIAGFAADLLPTLNYAADGVYLELAGGSPTTPAPTPNPTPAPTPVPVTHQPTNFPTTSAPTRAPVTPPPTSVPTNPPTSAPTNDPTPVPTSGPTLPQPTTPGPTPLPTQAQTPQPTNAPTPQPTPLPTPAPNPTNPPAQPTNAPTPQPTPLPTPAPNPTNDPVSSSTRILLTESGVAPITSGGKCPPDETTSVVIDGRDYTAGPGTISLYECSQINDSYDLINMRLENFPEGLWFELAFKPDSVDLVIKSLANYKEYWTHVRNSYVEDEYPEQPYTEHFPDFNWNTVPTWTRFHKKPNRPANPQPWNFNAGPWTDDEIKSIAENNFLSWYGVNAPAHVIDTWDRIKVASKDLDHDHKTLYYWNAESLWGSDGIEGFKDEFLGPGTGTGGRGLYDHSNSDMRNWWVGHGLDMSMEPSSNGVFTDNTISRECDNSACDLWGTEKSMMVEKLARDVPEDVLDIGNYLRQMIDDGNRFRMPYVDGTYFENTHFSPGNQNDLEGILVSMQLAREASWKKKVVMWTGSRRNCGCGFNNKAFPWCTPKVTTNCIPQYCNGFVQVDEEPTALLEKDFEIAMAEFLMIVEKWSYANFNVGVEASCERWRWDFSHMELFNKPLGAPLGPPLKSGHTFSRHFEHLSVKISIKKESYDDSAHGVGGDVKFIWR